MEWVPIATFVLSAVGVLIGVAQGYFALARHLRETTQSMRDEAARWSLEFLREPPWRIAAEAKGWAAVRLMRSNVDAPRAHLKEIRVLYPRGCKIALTTVTEPRDFPNGAGCAPEGIPVFAEATRRLRLGVEMEGDIGFDVQMRRSRREDHSTLWLFAMVPKRRFWRRSMRLQVRVIAEEISSMRRKISTVVSTEEIELAAETAATKR
jgi:hypothetical protein